MNERTIAAALLPPASGRTKKTMRMTQKRLSMTAPSRRRLKLAKRTGSDMRGHLSQRGDVAAAAAVDQERPDTGALGARDVLLGRIAHVKRLLPGAAGLP